MSVFKLPKQVFGERSGATTGSTTSSSDDEFLYTDNFFPDLSDFFDNLNMGDNDAVKQINSSSVAAATRPPLFDGMHYKRWRTKAVLRFTNLGCFSATDARPGPLSAEEQEKFEKVDAMFKAALFSILGDNIVDPYMAFDHGKDAWDALEAKFGVSDAGTELYVMEQYYDYRMTDERSVVEQAHEIQSLAKELEQFKCTLPDKFVAGGIIAKLPPSWRNFATSLKHKRQEFSVSDLIGSLHVEEKARAKDTRARSFEGGSSANVVQKKNFQSHKSKNKNNGKGKFDEKNKASNSTNFKRKTPYKKKGNCHHIAINKENDSCSVELWEIIVDGYRKPQDPVRLTSTEFYNRQLNASARDKIRSGINRKLLDQVNDIDSAKELWDRIVVLQEGTNLIQSALYESAKQEATMFMIREGESVADAYARLGALRVKVKGLGVEKYNDGFEMNEAFIKSKVIAMIAVKQEDTNLALNLQIITKSADLNADDLVSYVAANENMAKSGKRLMAMNRVDEASHNLALKARANHGREEVYEIEEDEEMTSTSDIATDFAFFAKKYKAKFPMLLNEKKKKKRTCYNCDEDSHFTNECPYEKRVDKSKFVKGVKPRLKRNPMNDRYKKNKGRAFVGAEYMSDEEEEDEEAGVAGLAFSKPRSLFTYDYSR
ncbi:hypothetical protein QYE76_010147 [Lolium multiflorum]|uniref:CCHC-type domain-containing protein n=1 Tax=Lolium multiflorum TaxID=4521 RepID=A0AAD8TWQ8_LOLMU|nr:hypothetical protein QYE76_010147 [Lolium multiflorum]